MKFEETQDSYKEKEFSTVRPEAMLKDIVRLFFFAVEKM